MQWYPALLAKLDQPIETDFQVMMMLAYVYQFHAELFQRWQYNPSFYKQLHLWAAKPWPDTVQWPDYLTCLELPQILNQDNEQQPKANYPDPYAVHVFWIQPLFFAHRKEQLQLNDITPIMNAVTTAQ